MDSNLTNIERETYFLIAKFLENGPCHEAAKALKKELHSYQILPGRTDWTGNTHPRVLEEMERLNGHLSNNYLAELMSRIGPLVEKIVPTNIHSLNSVLTAGRFSLLRETKDYIKNRTTISEATCYHGCPALPSVKARTSNFAQAIAARSWTGTSCKRNITYGCNSFSKVSMHKRILGHLASVYCVLFDKTGHVIATGADDNLVKLWSTLDGRLLATLRGHFGEISDLAINQENTLIAAGSCDKTIRIWNLRTTAPVAVLQGHTGMITSIEFCPSAHEDARYLMSTGGDGTVCFWKWDLKTNAFEATPLKFNEKSRPGAQMLCSSFSPGGSFLVTGSSDTIIRVYQMMPAPPERIAELSAHSDHVDSIQFNHSGDKFASGSRDGSAMIWQYYRNEWKHTLLNAYQQPKNSSNSVDEETLKSLKLKVTMVGWNLNDTFLVTAVTDHSLKVWDACTGDLVHVLTGHTDEMFVLECHPQEPYIFLSAGHDGNVIIWDLLKGVMIKSFFNLLEGQGHGAVFDSRFAPDGMRFAASDSHGHLCIFGFGSDDPYEKVPYEQFFHTDYRPLIRDANNYVLDEQTQMAPHLMPPPFLVDVDGNPHPPMYQLLIPGRNANNLPMRRVEIPISDLPPLMAEIAAAEAASAGRPNILSPERRRRSGHSPLRSPIGGGGGVGLRQTGDVEGVRQVNSNVFITQDVSEAERAAWRNRKIIPDEKKSTTDRNVACRVEQGREEIQRFLKEKKRRTLSTSQRAFKANNQDQNKGTPKKRTKGSRAAPRARITYTVPSEMVPQQMEDDEDEEDLVDVENFFSSASDSDWNSDSSESSDDSDWTEEAGIPAQEQREARRRRVRRVYSSCDDGEEEEEEEERNEEEIEIEDNDDDSNNKDEMPESPSNSKKEAKGKKKKPRKSETKIPSQEDKEEYFAFYRPPEWITSVQPQKSPYVPQIGDEVYYFRQGHELYVKAVVEGKVYQINPKKQCYCKYDLKAEELCRVMKIHYSTERPIICSLNLAIISPETGANTGGIFSVKYHDMAGVLDFFVLKQHYDQAVSRNWLPGDRFRCAIEDHWWSGTVVRKNAFQEEFPDSNFYSLEVRWDTGEEERMSPWDMELITDHDTDVSEEEDLESGTSNIPLTDEDRTLFDYTPVPSDWPDEDRDAAIRRISAALEQFSELPVAGPFAFPVDVENYADYWSVVPYPVDLNTIRERLVNKFYRRRNALLWETRLIEHNARLYNEENSEISINSTLVTKALVSFVCDSTRHDLIALYNEMLESGGLALEMTEEKNEVDSDSDRRPKKKSKSSRAKKKRRIASSQEETSESAGVGTSSGQSWSTVAGELLDFLISREDSDPFRQPVDTDRYPDYTSIVREPIDFSMIRQRLDNNSYGDPEPFVNDVRLVFSNSRLYNTNQRSRIYGMTLRLSALFEAKVQSVLQFSNERRKRNKRSSRPRRDQQPSDNNDNRSWSNFSISNQGTVSSEDQESSLRLVLRRHDPPISGVATRGETSEQGSSTASSSRRDNHVANGIADASAGSPRRTGIAINLRTGRARELNTDSSMHTDSDRETRQQNGETSSARENGHARPEAKRKRKKSKRLNLQRPLRIDHVRNHTAFESIPGPSESVITNGIARPKRNATKTKALQETNGSYGTRSSRRNTANLSNVIPDIAGNLGIENGVERNSKRKRKVYHSRVTETDSEDDENKIDNDDDGDESDSKVSKDSDDDDYDDDDNEIHEAETVNFEESSDDSENIQQSTRHMKTRARTKNSKRGNKNMGTSLSNKTSSRKRRRLSDASDSKSRKSRRTRLKVDYSENFDDDAPSSDETSNDEDEQSSDNEERSHIIGVSSRGRVRKAASRYLDYVDS